MMSGRPLAWARWAVRRRVGACLAHTSASTAPKPCMQPMVRHVAGLSRARVRDVEYLAADVKQFSLEVSSDFSHQPGQWTDVFMPDIDAVGGYSIASAPSQLSQAGTITLAIKAARHAPTEWMHRRAAAGTELLLRPGGSFIYEPPVHGRGVLLVAGGIGITPILSMLRHATESEPIPRVTLAYSARRPSDFAFAEAIEDIASTVRAGRVGVHLTVSRLEARRKRKTTATPASSTSEGGSNNDTAEAVVAAAAAATAAEALAEREGVALCMSNGLAKGRLTARRLREVLESGGRPPISEHDVYLCGPPAFITSLRQQLAEQGVPRSRVFFEQWW